MNEIIVAGKSLWIKVRSFAYCLNIWDTLMPTVQEKEVQLLVK